MNTRQVQAIEANVLAYYAAIARLLGGRFCAQDQVTWFVTGRQSLVRFNGILRLEVERAADLPAVVDPIVQTFVASRAPFFCAGWPPGGAPGLAGYLQNTGLPLQHVRMPAMARLLSAVPEPALPRRVEITPVQSQQDQDDWLQAHMEGFEEAEAARHDLAEVLANSLAEARPVFEHFLARCDGAPCAIASLLHAEHGAGVYHVATVPAYRGHGLGSAITLAAMQAAQRAGHEQAILFATPSGYPLYERLGFETVVMADLFACPAVPLKDHVR